LKFSILERFRRLSRAASIEEQAAILKLFLDLDAALANPHEGAGLGLRKIHPIGYWELRVGLSLRLFFRLTKDEAIFSFLGTHDEVKRFPKSL
jgi:hypothetical protein